jgi:hypothetical protein
MSQIFWTDKNSEPKRNHRFRVSFEGLKRMLKVGDINWMAEKVDRPKPSTAYNELQYYQHTFKYPGRTTWNDVTMTFRDPAVPDVMAGIYAVFRKSGYDIPNSPAMMTTISKKRMVAAVGDITCAVLNSDGVEIEKWVLRNAQIADITPSTLTHTDTEFARIDLTIKYDFAELNVNKAYGYEEDNPVRSSLNATGAEEV